MAFWEAIFLLVSSFLSLASLSLSLLFWELGTLMEVEEESGRESGLGEFVGLEWTLVGGDGRWLCAPGNGKVVPVSDCMVIVSVILYVLVSWRV